MRLGSGFVKKYRLLFYSLSTIRSAIRRTDINDRAKQIPKTILANVLPLYFSGLFQILDKLTALKIKESKNPIPKVKGERIKATKLALLNGS